MINLQCFIPGPLDATSYYRGWGPMTLLRKQASWLNPSLNGNCDWVSYHDADIVFVQRPSVEAQLNIVHMCMENGRPVWIDYDDDYINVSKSNPRRGTGLELRVANCVKRSLELATVVTVTNSHLKKIYSEFTDEKKIVVVENAMDDSLLGYWNLKPEISPQNVVLYRGNYGQYRDIEEFHKEILSVYRNNDTKNYNWMFMGDDPSWITDKMEDFDPKRLQRKMSVDIIEYHRSLCSINWAVIIKPLQDTVFNRSRSHITWIEACLAGSLCLAPAWDSWSEATDPNSIVLYESPDDFKKLLTHYLTHPNEIAPRVQSGREFIKKNLLLSTINNKRLDIIKNLLAGVNNYGESNRDPNNYDDKFRPGTAIGTDSAGHTTLNS